MKNAGMKLLLAAVMVFTSSPVFAAKRTKYLAGGQAGIQKLLQQTGIHKKSVSIETMLEAYKSELPTEYHSGVEKMMAPYMGKVIQSFKVKKLKSKAPFQQYRFIGGTKDRPIYIDIVFEEKVFARVNGQPITYRAMSFDGGQNAISEALKIQPLGLLTPEQMTKLNKKNLKEYMKKYRSTLVALEKYNNVLRKLKPTTKRKKKSSKEYSFINNLIENGLEGFLSSINTIVNCNISSASANDYNSGAPCVNAGHVSSYANGSCGIPSGMSCDGGIKCNPAIFGRNSSGGAFCVPADNLATTSCDQKVPLTSEANLRTLVTSLGKDFNRQSVEEVNASLRQAIASCSQLPASARTDQTDACAVLQSRFRDLEETTVTVAAIQPEVVEDIPPPPSEDRERKSGIGDWFSKNWKWLAIGAVVLVGGIYLFSRNRGGKDKKHPPHPTPEEPMNGDPGSRLPPYTASVTHRPYPYVAMTANALGTTNLTTPVRLPSNGIRQTR